MPPALFRHIDTSGDHLDAFFKSKLLHGSFDFFCIQNRVYRQLSDGGVRMLEPACGPCVGMGQAPPSGSNSLRTFNRNFPGRSGTPEDSVYLCSPAVAAV